MVIRPARLEERAMLIELQRAASLMHADSRAALLAHPEAIDLPEAHLPHTIVAERDGAVIGFAVTLPIDSDQADLDGLFVAPDVWRSGAGRALVAAAARDRALVVVANPNALHFYERCSFIETGSTETRFGPAITMTRPKGAS
jgi:GNAT superfamily N-acetyltransferase